ADRGQFGDDPLPDVRRHVLVEEPVADHVGAVGTAPVAVRVGLHLDAPDGRRENPPGQRAIRDLPEHLGTDIHLDAYSPSWWALWLAQAPGRHHRRRRLLCRS